MRMPTTIRRLKIVKLRTAEHPPWDLLLAAEPMRERVQLLLEKGRCYVALHHHEVVGVFILLAPEAGVVELAAFCVEARRRGQGLGRSLVLNAIDRARALHANRLISRIGNTNLAAFALLQKCGFRLTSLHPDFYLQTHANKVIEHGILRRDMLLLSLDLH